MDNVKIQKQDDIDLLAVNIHCKLKFDKHVSLICEKVNKQLQVIKRFRNLIPTTIKMRLYKAFIQPIRSSVL